jgi:sterol desaturase/sphingolipid hydroxylase (fatty acid hydroxylase superfamily)
VRHPTPWLLGGWVIAAVVGRVVIGSPWRWRELIVVAVLVVLQPFAEWVIHVGILHWRPRRIGRLTLDLHMAKEHRDHHRDPRDLEILFVPMRGLFLAMIGTTTAAWFLAASHGEALTISATVGLQFCVYEWIHYLIHTPYRPRSAWYRSLWRNHRLHHFRNERYWLGVTSNLGDRILGTNPAKGEVPMSPTAQGCR